jgi:hypothetical protein
MKNIILIGLMALFVFTLQAQTLKQYNGSFNFIVLNSSTPPEYNVTGFFNDFSGQNNANGLDVGDIFFDVKGDRYEVISISAEAASNPGVITMVIESINPGTPAPQAGVGMLNEETANLVLPLTTANISENLQSIIQTHMALKIDTEAGGGNGTITDGKNALFIEEDTTIVLGGDQDRNTFIQGTEDFYFTLQNKTLVATDTFYRTITNRGSDALENTKAILIKTMDEASDQVSHTNDGRGSAIRVTPEEVFLISREGGVSASDASFSVTREGVAATTADTLIYMVSETRDEAEGETRIYINNPNVTPAWEPKPSNGSALSVDENGQIILVESGSGTGPFRYTINDGASVTASGLGVTYSVTSGVGTFTIPPGVLLFSARVKGETADLVGDNFVVEFDYGAEGNNTDVDDVFPASIQIINSASEQLGGPTDALPFVHDLNTTVQVQLIDIDAGMVSHRFVNLDAISDWYLLFTF